MFRSLVLTEAGSKLRQASVEGSTSRISRSSSKDVPAEYDPSTAEKDTACNCKDGKSDITSFATCAWDMEHSSNVSAYAAALSYG
eukprot:s58_g35.t1